MDKQQLTQFVKDMLQEVWSNLDESKVSKYYSNDIVAHFGKQTVHYKDILHRIEYVKANYSSLTNDIKSIIVDGNQVAVYNYQTITRKGNHKEESYIVMAIYHIVDNKVTELFGCIDPNINYFE